MSAGTVLNVQNAATVVTGVILIIGLRWLLGAVCKWRVQLMGVPVEVWQASVTLRGSVLLTLFIADVCIQNPVPPPWMAQENGVGLKSFVAHLSNFDGRWYIGIAEHGYRQLAEPGYEDRSGE